MRHNDNTTVAFLSNALSMEKVRMGVSVFISLLACVFYVKTTENGKWYQRINGPLTNELGSIFSIKSSVDALFEMRNEPYGKAKACLLAFVAMLLYSPQVFITIFGSKDSKAFTAFTAVATALSGVGLYSYASVELFEFARYQGTQTFRTLSFYARKHTIGVEDSETFCKNNQAIIVKNLEHLLERVRHANYSDVPVENLVAEDAQDLLHKCLALSHQVPFYEEPLMLQYSLQAVTLITQVAFVSLMIYSNIGYLCAMENDLVDSPFNFPEAVSVTGTLIISFFQFILNAIAGFSLGHAAIDLPRTMSHYHRMPNEFNLGGSVLKWISMSAPMIALLTSWGSGLTSVNLLNNDCPTSFFGRFRTPGDENTVSYSAFGFNSVFDTKGINMLVQYIIKHKDNDALREKERAYLQLTAQLEKLIKAVRSTHHLVLNNTFGELLNEWNDPDLFLPSEKQEEKRLLRMV